MRSCSVGRAECKCVLMIIPYNTLSNQSLRGDSQQHLGSNCPASCRRTCSSVCHRGSRDMGTLLFRIYYMFVRDSSSNAYYTYTWEPWTCVCPMSILIFRQPGKLIMANIDLHPLWSHARCFTRTWWSLLRLCAQTSRKGGPNQLRNKSVMKVTQKNTRVIKALSSLLAWP